METRVHFDAKRRQATTARVSRLRLPTDYGDPSASTGRSERAGLIDLSFRGLLRTERRRATALADGQITNDGRRSGGGRGPGGGLTPGHVLSDLAVYGWRLRVDDLNRHRAPAVQAHSERQFIADDVAGPDVSDRMRA